MKALGVILAGMLIGGCAALQYGPPHATADLKNAAGEPVGMARFWEDADGVHILVQVQGLTPGEHGIHLHALGKCDPPDFATAGAHFKPAGRQHGLKNPAGAHAGDLPNLEVSADGRGGLNYVNRQVTLGPGPASLLGPDRTTLVIHANPDDAMTDPSGNSGGRIACGIIRG